MNPFLLGLIVILLGLGICYLSTQAGAPLAPFFKWAGILAALLGLLIVLFPVLAYIYRNLCEALGVAPGR